MIPFYENKTVCLQARRETSQFEFPVHLHDRVEFIYIHNGEININSVGRCFKLVKGDFAIIFPFSIHSYEFVKSKTADYSIAILRNEDADEFREILLSTHPSSPVISSSLLHGDVVRIMEEFVNSSIDNMPLNFSLFKSLYKLLLARTLPLLHLKHNNSGIPTNMIVRVVLYVSEHFKENISLKTLADEMALSRYCLSRLFNQKLNIGFSKYINYIRIEHAKQLLESGNMSIINVALDSGFENIRTFNRSFKELCGTTPLRFRKDHDSSNR